MAGLAGRLERARAAGRVGVLVDTSAWVDFFNGYPSAEKEAVAELLAGDEIICTCGLVMTEVLQGLRKTDTSEEIEARFRDLVFLEPLGPETYARAADVYRTLRSRGVTVRSTVDCILVTLAAENACAVLARDRDIDAIIDSHLLDVDHWHQE